MYYYYYNNYYIIIIITVITVLLLGKQHSRSCHRVIGSNVTTECQAAMVSQFVWLCILH